MRAGTLLAILCCLACGPQAPPGVREEYLQLQRRALEEARSFGAGDGSSRGLADPRPVWADKLVAFAMAHPEAPEAAEALLGAARLRSSSQQIAPFFEAYDMLLEKAPGASGLSEVFPLVATMRMVEAGGPEILHATDPAARYRASRRAAVRIVSDMQRAIEAAPGTAALAAAHYTLASTYYQLDVKLSEALEHFKIVAEQHPSSVHAASAREHVREIETLGVGQPAPDFEATALDGRKVSLSSLKGKVVLVDFWATWCEPCQEALPDLKRAYYKLRGRGFAIVGVSLDTDPNAVKTFVTDHIVRWPIVADGLGSATPIAKAYSVQGLPMSYLVDRQGRIRRRALPGIEVAQEVEELLGRPGARL